MSREVEVISTQENETTMNDLDGLSSRPDPYVELVWENGQVIMQSQPNNNAITLSSDVSRDVTDPIRSKTIRSTTMESTSTDTGLYQNSEMARWFSYSIREPTLDDYTTQFLHDLSGATFNDLSLENILPSKERKSSFNNGDGSRNANSIDEVGNIHYPKTYTETAPNEGDHVIPIDSVCKPSSSICAFTSMRLQRLKSSCVANFGHIRSLGGGKSNLDNNNEHRDMINCHNRDVCHEYNALNNASSNKLHKAGVEVGQVGENNVERVVAVSSVCSGNSGERGSSEAERDLKRKSRENGDSDGPSEEHESGSIGVTQASTVRKGAKRRRAAEVHNLSERRRRDRINEKMRALQELIPNCNKADKASMLDEAIEYLKALQNQVQMLSFGPSMYIPPMAGLPHGIPHLNGSCVSQSSHVGPTMNMMNMNMGLGGIGYGTNMLNNLQPFQGGQQFLGQQNAMQIYQGMSNSGLTIGHPCPSQGVPLGVPGLPVSGPLNLKVPIESNFLGSQDVRSQVTMPIPNVIDSVSQPSVQTSNASIVRAVPSHGQSRTPNT